MRRSTNSARKFEPGKHPAVDRYSDLLPAPRSVLTQQFAWVENRGVLSNHGGRFDNGHQSSLQMLSSTLAAANALRIDVPRSSPMRQQKQLKGHR
jgi:hypothetical protein